MKPYAPVPAPFEAHSSGDIDATYSSVRLKENLDGQARIQSDRL